MTLISLTTNYARPIIMGDILVSSTDSPDNILIPSFPSDIKAHLPIDQGIFPHSFRQKIYVINDKISLGLAGNVYEMIQFLTDFKDYFKYRDATIDNCDKFLEEYDVEIISKCSILICVIRQHNTAFEFTFRTRGYWQEHINPFIERVICTGSGANTLINKVEELRYLPHSDARSANMTLLSLFLAEERLTLNNIINAWGAGYEIIHCNDGIFKKIDDVTFVTWNCKLKDNGIDLEFDPALIVHNKYHNDILIVTSYMGGKIARYGVLPLDLKPENVEIKELPGNINFKSSLLMSTFIIKHTDGKYYFPTVLTEPENGLAKIMVEVEFTGDIKVLIADDLTRQIASFMPH